MGWVNLSDSMSRNRSSPNQPGLSPRIRQQQPFSAATQGRPSCLDQIPSLSHRPHLFIFPFLSSSRLALGQRLQTQRRSRAFVSRLFFCYVSTWTTPCQPEPPSHRAYRSSGQALTFFLLSSSYISTLTNSSALCPASAVPNGVSRLRELLERSAYLIRIEGSEK